MKTIRQTGPFTAIFLFIMNLCIPGSGTIMNATCIGRGPKNPDGVSIGVL